MICGHCGIGFSPSTGTHKQISATLDGIWIVEPQICTECGKANIFLIEHGSNRLPNGGIGSTGELSRFLAFPSVTPNVHRAPREVPNQFAVDFDEAATVLALSPKASAALSRRCLQHLLREHFKTTKRDLFEQIDEVIDAGTIPSHLTELLDAIRVVGNYAAHPLKSTSTGEVLEVEPGEAECNLETLLGLFDFCFVAPMRTAERKAALNKKLSDAGKTPIK